MGAPCCRYLDLYWPAPPSRQRKKLLIWQMTANLVRRFSRDYFCPLWWQLSATNPASRTNGIFQFKFDISRMYALQQRDPLHSSLEGCVGRGCTVLVTHLLSFLDALQDWEQLFSARMMHAVTALSLHSSAGLYGLTTLSSLMSALLGAESRSVPIKETLRFPSRAVRSCSWGFSFSTSYHCGRSVRPGVLRCWQKQMVCNGCAWSKPRLWIHFDDYVWILQLCSTLDLAEIAENSRLSIIRT